MLSSAIKTQGNKTHLISLLTQKRSKTKILLLPTQNNLERETIVSLPILSRVRKRAACGPNLYHIRIYFPSFLTFVTNETKQINKTTINISKFKTPLDTMKIRK